MNSRRRLVAGALVVAALAHVLLWLPMPLVVKAGAVLTLAALLPGWLLVGLALDQSQLAVSSGERLCYAIGGGLAQTVTVMLLIAYLPGGITWWLALLLFDGIWIGLLLLTVRGAVVAASPHQRRSRGQAQPWMIVLTLVLVLAGALRFAYLGYTEFLTDEARVVLRAAAVIQGNEDVLFLHRKGPAEILLPATIFALVGTLNEAAARLPFALASLAAVATVFYLGRRLFGRTAGLIAAFLLALEGYLIGFAHFVQFQSLVVLFGALVMLLLVSEVERLQPARGRFILLALLAAGSLLAHYDGAAVALPAAATLIWLIGRSGSITRQWWRAMWPALLLAAAILALFYVPFLLHPQFQATYHYLVDQRLVADRTLPFNNLRDFFERSTVYNSAYYELFLIAAGLLALLDALQRGWGQWRATILGGGVAAVLAYTCWRPDWLRWGELDLAGAPFAFAFVLVWLAPRLKWPERLLWLWFGSLALFTLFLIAYPRTHVYLFMTPWVLLVGGFAARLAMWLRRHWGGTPMRLAAVAAMLVGAILLGLHPVWYFAAAPREALRHWEQDRLPGYWTPFGRPTIDALYGFPLANGWKVAGVLYEQGVLTGDYETNQRDDLIPAWYTRAQFRCATTASWYFAIDSLEFWAQNEQPSAETLAADDYHPWGVVTVRGAAHMTIYQRATDLPTPVRTLALEDYAPSFDAHASADLALGYPVVEPAIANAIHANLGDQVWLEGYALDQSAPLRPGDAVTLTLYWRGQQAGLPPYKVFNQAYYGDGVMVAQQDGIPVCNRRPTPSWQPGELIVDTYRLVIAADAPPGAYPLYTGLYREPDFQRLPVLDAAGQPLAEFIQVGELKVDDR